MSMMYGKRRVVLSDASRLVVICGSDSPSANYPGTGKKAGCYHPLGFWYADDGLFYVDLKSRDQLYSSVSRDTIACKRLGGVPSKKALREFVMNYYETLPY
jgi:hypothetical protein